MNRLLKVFIYLAVLSMLISGCNQNKKTATNHSNGIEEKTSIIEKNEEIIITAKEGTPDWTFQHLVKAVAEDNLLEFMKYQYEENILFYKEQKRWIEEAVFKKGQGYSLSIEFSGFQQESDTNGRVILSVKMKHPEGIEEFNNTVIYECIKVDDVWLLNDVPFKTLTSENGWVTVYYKEGEDGIAETTIKDAENLMKFYATEFRWVPNPISVKIFSSPVEVSATVPWTIVGGWNEIGESLKITSQNKDDIFRLLAHELTHKMLSDLTNDNAILFFQEGLATYLENKVQKDPEGKIYFDQSIVNSKSIKAIQVTNSVLSIDELAEIDYAGNSTRLYRDGSLITNYLVLTHGLEKYLEMLSHLAQYDYIDKRLEHKLETIRSRSLEALEKTYGPKDELTKKYTEYYLN
ncbi:hypothetical protein ACFSO7_16445 [Bacillus sp. CGMCC 1.16607]|uniref:hypothetical protein n=1 Tax=Bacillus sp. CGMCC 1.16607 TaxID=3351842 RepID=UPI0036337FEC